MDKQTQIKLAEDFAKLHFQEEMLVLPNAWDGGSAKIFERSGFKAVATTSAGVAFSFGFPDGEKISIDDLVYITKQITRVVKIPLTVDMELGYGVTTEEIVKNVGRIIEAGAVGINIEDGHPTDTPYLEDVATMTERIQAIKVLKQQMGIPFTINARTCTYLLGIGEESKRMELAVNRCDAYSRAGADCVFVPGTLDEATVKNLREAIKHPLNILLNKGFNDLDKLSAMGVNRLSVGSAAMRTICNSLMVLARQLKEDKEVSPMLEHSFSLDTANKFFGEE